MRSTFHALAFTFLVLLFGVTNSVGQESFGGRPMEGVSSPTITIIPEINPADLRSCDSWQMTHGGTPLIVGRAVPQAINFFQAATRVQSHGRTIYQLALSLPEAQALSVSFDRLKLKAGDKLFVFDPDQRQIIGSLTDRSNPDGGVFGTRPVPGQTIVIQYEPAGTPGDIHIAQFGYFYNLPMRAADNRPRNNPGEGASGVCNVNVNCPEGDLLQDVKNGIVQIMTLANGYYALCSGTLLNNTAQDFRPLIISASHCAIIEGREATEQEMRQWVFNFHYERPECANNKWVLDEALSMTGAKILSIVPQEHGSDGLLMELLHQIPDYYGAYYNGWDRSGTLVSEAYGLHHPKGDAMKISTINVPLINTTWTIGQGASMAHFGVRYAKTENGHCVTEGGSSGSGLFDPNLRLIGTLTGGSAECEHPRTLNMYGKLSSHWQYAKRTDTREALSEILDPVGHGSIMTTNGCYKPGAALIQAVKGLQGAYTQGQVSLHWSPLTEISKDIEAEIEVLREAKLLQTLPISTSSFIDTEPQCNGGIVTYTLRYKFKVKGTNDYLYTAPRHISFVLTELEGVRNIKVEQTERGTQVSWRKPLNRQLLSQLTLSSASEASVVEPLNYPGMSSEYREVYLGVRYPGIDFSSLGTTRVAGMRLLPARSSKIHSYELFIRNGLRVHVDGYGDYKILDDDSSTALSYPISTPFDEAKWIEINGFTPKVINHKEMLVVGYKLTTKTDFNRRVAFVDKTPATPWSSAMNVLSFDSRYWMPADVVGALPMGNSAFAIELIIDNGEPGDKADLSGTIPRGFHAAAWPEVKEYIIYADDKEIARTTELSYTLPEGVNANALSIKPLYEDGRVASVEEISAGLASLQVYPTIVDTSLHIDSTDGTTGIYQLFDTAGRLICEGSISPEAIDTSHWAPGQYLLQITLQDRTSTIYRIIKR